MRQQTQLIFPKESKTKASINVTDFADVLIET